MMYHDIKQHLNMMKYYVDQEKLHEASSYLAEFTDRFEKASSWNTGIETLDIVLNLRKEIIIKSGIELTYDIGNVNLEDIHVLDQNIIFSNLLDNCIEGTMGITESIIHLKIKPWRNERTILIKFSNTAPRRTFDDNGIIKSTKREIDNHGYGLKIISKIVLKYHGTFTITYTDEKEMVEASILFEFE